MYVSLGCVRIEGFGGGGEVDLPLLILVRRKGELRVKLLEKTIMFLIFLSND